MHLDLSAMLNLIWGAHAPRVLALAPRQCELS
jgi:hypothetical protein